MTKFGPLIPKYIFVQYQYVLLTKFRPLMPKYIFVLCIYLILIAVLIYCKYICCSKVNKPPFTPPFNHMWSARKPTAVANRGERASWSD
jgi:hypothetical protein